MFSLSPLLIVLRLLFLPLCSRWSPIPQRDAVAPSPAGEYYVGPQSSADT